MQASRSRRLWRVTVLTSAEAEEAVAELLSEVYGQSAVTFADLERRKTSVTVYLVRRPRNSGAARARLRAGLQRVEAFGLNLGAARIQEAEVPRVNWAEAWKRHFRPMTIGGVLLVKPSWSRRRARRGQALVVIDPGLSFGTGQHPTTAFCLAQLVAQRRPSEQQSFLDVGTGSGILAIAAARLGYQPVRAFDRDPDAVRIAHANGRSNGVGRKVEFRYQDLGRLPIHSRERYSLVCANLTSDLLVRGAQRILARVEPEGRLVLAGVLRGEFAEVQQAYAVAGWRLVASRSDKEWRSGAFEARAD